MQYVFRDRLNVLNAAEQFVYFCKCAKSCFSRTPVSVHIGLGVYDYDEAESHAKEFPVSQIIQHPSQC